MLRLRFLVRRFPILYWVGALALTVCTGVGMARMVGGAQAASARFGSLRPVLVAVRSVPGGSVLRRSDVSVRHLPAALVPADPVPEAGADRVVGHVVLVPLAPGEVVLASKVAPTGLQGVSALLPDGARGLAVPVGPTTPPLNRGDHVDVLASFESDPAPAAAAAPASAAAADTATDSVPTFPVARAALVLDVGHQAITLAVSPDEAPRLAYALTHGTVTLALTAP